MPLFMLLAKNAEGPYGGLHAPQHTVHVNVEQDVLAWCQGNTLGHNKTSCCAKTHWLSSVSAC